MKLKLRGLFSISSIAFLSVSVSNSALLACITKTPPFSPDLDVGLVRWTDLLEGQVRHVGPRLERVGDGLPHTQSVDALTLGPAGDLVLEVTNPPPAPYQSQKRHQSVVVIACICDGPAGWLSVFL